MALIGSLSLMAMPAQTHAQMPPETEPPYPMWDAAFTQYNEPVSIDIVSNDVEGSAAIDPTSVEITRAPEHGSLEIDPNTGEATYTPYGAFAGLDYFQYTVKDVNGLVCVEAADVSIDLFNDTPQILEFEAIPGGQGDWVIMGYVDDEKAEDMTVELTGLVTATVEVDDYGYFHYWTTIPAESEGTIFADTTDELGEEASTVMAFIEYFQ